MKLALTIAAGLFSGSLLLQAQTRPLVQKSHWELIGPGGGGALFRPAISPADSNTVAVACDMTGAYISRDGAVSWQIFNLRSEVRFFAFDPHDPKTLYAKSNALYRTRDAGKSWELVFPSKSSLHGIQITGDHAAERLLTLSGVARDLTALAIDPRNSSLLYAAFHDQTGSSLRISRNAGRSWKKAAALPAPAQYIFVDQSSGAELHVGAATYFGTLHAGQFRIAPMPPVNAPISSLAGGFSSGKPLFYAVAGNAIFVRDQTDSWAPSSVPVQGAIVKTIAASSRHPEVAYASFTNQRPGEESNPKPSFGVLATRDAGKTWEIVWDEAKKRVENPSDDWIAKTFGPEYPGAPVGLSVDPKNPERILATDLGRVLLSDDGGRTWRTVYSRQEANGVAGTGIEATTNYGVHFDPFNLQRIFISYTDIGLMRSEDSGKSWASSMQGIPRPWTNTAYWVVFDPTVQNRMWAVMSKTHDLPRPKMWQKRTTDHYEGGVVFSEDGGKSWRVSNQGMLNTAPTHILLDPTSPPDARVVYVAAMGRGVYKSSDGGRSWTLKNGGIDGKEPLAWRLARDSKGVIYVIVFRRSDDGSIGNEDDGALYRSIDGAEHWTKLNLPSGVNGPGGLSIDPNDGQRLYLAAWARSTPGRPLGGGIYVSTDAGSTWKAALVRDQHIYDVTIDPHNSRKLYAAGFEAAAWRSDDRGITWQQIRGFDFKWGHRVMPDPKDPDLIYVTTFGGGVWRGPSTGDPSAAALPLPK